MELLKVENLTFTYPKQNPDAKKYDEVTIDEVIEKNLQVVDMTASILSQNRRFRMYLFRCRKERLWWFAENPDVARPRC